MKNQVTITLEEPVTHGDTTHDTIVFSRKRKVRDLLAADGVKGQLNKTAAVYASMADVPVAVILDLDADAYADLEAKVEPLMGKSWSQVKLDFMAEDAMSETISGEVRAEMERRAKASD